jgi:signal transduction histidine kinase
MSVDFLYLAGSALLELPQFAIIITDSDYRIAHWSTGAEQLFKIRSEAAVGQRLEHLIRFADMDFSDNRRLCGCLGALESHQVENIDKLMVESICFSLEDNSRTMAGFLFVMQDVTEKRRTEEACAKAKEANELKDRFLATAAHELRTPLNAILGWTRLLRLQMVDTAEVLSAFATIEHNAMSLSRLIEDLLDVSRIIADKLRLDIGAVDLVVVIDKAVHAQRAAALSKQIRIDTALDASVGAVAGDPDRLQQIVGNLLSNAIKFSPREGVVKVKLEGASDRARIVVSDEGPGISEEFLPHIFEPFTQATAASTKRQAGLGLGLAIVQRLVDLHKGTIQVDSRKGYGAQFAVELPLWRELTAASSTVGPH